MNEYELYHHGILGMHWGIRRYQNPDGSLTAAGKQRYSTDGDFAKKYDSNRKMDQKSYELSRQAQVHKKKSEYYDQESTKAANYSEKKMWKYADKSYDENKKYKELKNDSEYLKSDFKSDTAKAFFLVGSLGSIPATYFVNRQMGKDRALSFIDSLALSPIIGGTLAGYGYSTAKKQQEKTKQKYGLR